MGRKSLDPAEYSTLVAERLRQWGMIVRKQRVSQGIAALDLCARLGISHPTLRNIEGGDPAVSTVHYLSALHVLGILGAVAPQPDPSLWTMTHDSPRARAKVKDSNDYF